MGEVSTTTESVHTESVAPDESRPVAAIVTPLLILALTLPVWLTWMAATFNGLITAESMHYGQVSRNLATGHGFTTSVIVPASLADRPDLIDHPDLMVAPLFVIWEALWFLIFHAGDKVCVLASSSVWILTVLLTYFFATSLFSRKAAIWTVVLLWMNPWFLNASIAATPTALAALWITAIGWTMTARINPAEPESFPRRWFFASAAFVGLAALTDYDLIWAIGLPALFYWVRRPAANGLNQPLEFNGTVKKGFALHLWFKQRMAPRLLFDYLLIVFLVTLPWLVRNYFVTDSPFHSLKRFELLTGTEVYPGQSIFRFFEQPGISAASAVFNHPGEILGKGVTGFVDAMSTAMAHINPLIVVLFLFGLFMPGPDGLRRVQRYILLMLVLYLLRISFYGQQFDRAIVFAPLLTLFTVGIIFSRFEIKAGEEDASPRRRRSPRLFRNLIKQPRQVKLLGACALLSVIMLWAFRFQHDNHYKVKPSANVEHLMDHTPEHQFVLTPSPWLVAWHGRIRTVWMPQTETSRLTLNQTFGKKIRWIYFPRKRARLPEDVVPDFWWSLISEPDKLPGYKPFSSKVTG
ncbi:MAG: glycosyltransferase family 39 protein, partial [Verrucomicrobiota bacterium]